MLRTERASGTAALQAFAGRTIASFRGEHPVRHAGASRRLGGRIENVSDDRLRVGDPGECRAYRDPSRRNEAHAIEEGVKMTDVIAGTEAPVDGSRRAEVEAALALHRSELTGYCYRMLGSVAEAEDAVQDTLLRAWRASDSFEGRAAVRSWLYRIATNVCLDMLKSRKRAGPAGRSRPRGDRDHTVVNPTPGDHVDRAGARRRGAPGHG